MRSILAGLRTLTLPWGAGPGTARLVLGPDLPPPLKTYLFFGQRVASEAIIYYSGTPSNDDYQFEALVELPGTHFVYRGSVLNGVVLEESVGHPNGFYTSFSGGGLENFQIVGTGAFSGVFSTGAGAASYFLGREQAFPPIGVDPVAIFDYINAADPTQPTPTVEVWHTLGLAAGWSGAGGTSLKYRMIPSPALSVQIIGNLVAGTKADGTSITILPVDYWPNMGQDIMTNAFGGVLTTAQNPHVNIRTDGLIQIFGIGTSTNMNINGIYALHAA